MEKMTNKQRTNWIAKTGVLAAAAIILMILEFPLPLMPNFLKFDLSEIPVLVAAFAFGPWSAVIIEFIKNIAHYPLSFTFGIGELANFIVGCSLVVPAGIIYRLHRTKKAAVVGMLSGTLLMMLIGCLMNYYVMIPFYVNVTHYPLTAIIEGAKEVGNTLVRDLPTLIVFVFAPFNLFKGIVVSFIVAIIYKRISPLLHKEYAKSQKSLTEDVENNVENNIEEQK